jgi:hypothetical protein
MLKSKSSQYDLLELESTHSESSSDLSDYGYFSDTISVESLSSIKSDSNLEFCNKIQSLLDKKENKDVRVIFSYINEKSSVICRSFTSIQEIYQNLIVSLQGFRIVQTHMGERAEFLLSVDINGSNFKLWKRFSSFEKFAEMLKSSKNLHEDIIMSWLNVINHKDWFRNLSISYLIKKTLRLELFLRAVVFHLECPLNFLSFLGDEYL